MSDFGWFCIMMISITALMYAEDIIKAWQDHDDE